MTRQEAFTAGLLLGALLHLEDNGGIADLAVVLDKNNDPTEEMTFVVGDRRFSIAVAEVDMNDRVARPDDDDSAVQDDEQ